MPDLTKLIMHSGYPGFKNTIVYRGVLNITGNTTTGVNTRSTSMTLLKQPEMIDITFNGPGFLEYDDRTDDAWFKNGYAWTFGTGSGYVDEPMDWSVTSGMNGKVLTVTAIYVQQFTANIVVPDTKVYFKLVDYVDF